MRIELRHLTATFAAAVWTGLPGLARAAAPEAPRPAPAGPAAPAKPAAAVEELFSPAPRNPFVKVEGGAAQQGGGFNGLVPPEEFSLHGLVLKAVMEDPRGLGFAILADPKYGASFVLRRGKLYDSKERPVPGVTGKVKAKQRTVELYGRDRERRILTMNERDEDQDTTGPR